MKRPFRASRRSKAGAVDGLNLFFGALLGANLGTLEGLRLVDYVQLIAVLAATVMALRAMSLSEKRVHVVLLLAASIGLLFGLLTLPVARPMGLAEEDLQRLVGTLAVWLFFVVVIGLAPLKIDSEGSHDAAP